MMDELFDEEALRKAYDKAKEKKMRDEYRAEGQNDLINNLRKLGISEDILKKAADQSAASAQ